MSLRHGRCFWFSGQSRGDHCKAGVSEGCVASMHGFGAVWRQDAAILPHTSCDGQTGLVPHGFRKRQLYEETQREDAKDSRGESFFEKDHSKETESSQQMQDRNIYTHTCTVNIYTCMRLHTLLTLCSTN